MSGKTHFKTKGSWVTLYVMVGILSICVGAFMVMHSNMGGIFIGSGVLMLVVGFWSKSADLVALHGDHMEMKLALLAPRKLVRYSEMMRIVTKSEKKASLVVNIGGKQQELNLPLAALAPEDATALLQSLRQRMKKD